MDVVYNVDSKHEDELIPDMKTFAEGLKLLQFDYLGGNGSRGYGKVVFQAKNYDTWSKDGQIHQGLNPFNGEGLSDGVYYFTFTYKGKAKTFSWSGSITIVR
jgi:CRISPR/Cas system CSM-associated protein Csm3 (group 7 of RAMP superfamily)